MRRGVWVVLGLVGMAPVGALAQEARGRSAEQARVLEQASNEALQQQITELWQGFRQLQQEVAALRGEAGGGQAAPAVGGSGQAGDASGMGGSGQAGGTSGMGGSGQADRTVVTEDTSGLVIVEMPARAGQGQGGQMAGQGGQRGQGGGARAGSATGGSGANMGGAALPDAQDEHVFLGQVRTVTQDRLLMVDPQGRLFEFGLSGQTRVIGPRGASASLRTLKEGTPVRTVTKDGEQRSQVIILQVLEPAPKPSR